MRILLAPILCVLVSLSPLEIAEGQVSNTAPANDNPLSGLNLGDTARTTAALPTFPWGPVIPNNLGTQYSSGFDAQDAHAIGHELGARWLRIECGWSNVEATKGTYTFASI